VSVRIKVDEDLPRQIADLLIASGHDAATVVQQGWQGVSAEVLWPRVQNEGRWLITADKGFADLRLHRPGTHAGDSAGHFVRRFLTCGKKHLRATRLQHPSITIMPILTGRVRSGIE
jgi:hypothetical protein